ncbi:MAG TPA: Gfo/Idh/MocA family oxidoreductase [Victivallales bacterium]|nr:Gfo/Idh/MocA family oxidoreductase [Victivallales bacterium]
MNKRKVRWGIAGLGNIAKRFADDLVRYAPSGELCSVASSSIDKAKQFAEKFNCKKYYDSYMGLASDSEIDVVYISTINPFHKQLARLFLEHGKHVLVEKPAFINKNDWDEIFRIAEYKGLLLVEAMKTVTFPAYRKLVSFLKENQIKLDLVQASFGTTNEFDANHWLFNKDQSGGASLDVGIYPLWLYSNIVYIMGGKLSEPSVKISTEKYNIGVDESVEFLFDSAIKGELSASITSDLPRHARLSGIDIDILITDKWWNPKKIKITWKGKRFDIDEPIVGGGFQFEAEHMSDLILNKKKYSDLIISDISRNVIELIENALKKNSLKHLVS